VRAERRSQGGRDQTLHRGVLGASASSTCLSSCGRFYVYTVYLVNALLAKVVYLRMNQRHPHSRHTPHGGSENTDTVTGSHSQRENEKAQSTVSLCYTHDPRRDLAHWLGHTRGVRDVYACINKYALLLSMIQSSVNTQSLRYPVRPYSYTRA